jgi:hypothetical protein
MGLRIAAMRFPSGASFQPNANNFSCRSNAMTTTHSLIPEGMLENSPTFQRSFQRLGEAPEKGIVTPEGTAEAAQVISRRLPGEPK